MAFRYGLTATGFSSSRSSPLPSCRIWNRELAGRLRAHGSNASIRARKPRATCASSPPSHRTTSARWHGCCVPSCAKRDVSGVLTSASCWATVRVMEGVAVTVAGAAQRGAGSPVHRRRLCGIAAVAAGQPASSHLPPPRSGDSGNRQSRQQRPAAGTGNAPRAGSPGGARRPAQPARPRLPRAPASLLPHRSAAVQRTGSTTLPSWPANCHQDAYTPLGRPRHHHIRYLRLMYYPQETPQELGPTHVIPGTHLNGGLSDSERARPLPLRGRRRHGEPDPLRPGPCRGRESQRAAALHGEVHLHARGGAAGKRLVRSAIGPGPTPGRSPGRIGWSWPGRTCGTGCAVRSGTPAWPRARWPTTHGRPR